MSVRLLTFLGAGGSVVGGIGGSSLLEPVTEFVLQGAQRVNLEMMNPQLSSPAVGTPWLRSSWVAVVKLLLRQRHKIDADSRDAKGRTPLLHAVTAGHLETV